MASLKNLQERIDKLLEDTTPKENLQKWVKGYIPEHYKKLSISREKAIEYATEGAVISLSHYDDKLFFTQAMINGAIMSGDFDSIYMITSSHTGKSYGLGQVIPLYAFYNNEKIDVVGNTEIVTDKFMGWVNKWIAKAPREVTKDLVESVDKLEKLRQSTTKKGLSWAKRNSEVKVITLAGTSIDPLKSQAIGESGAKVIDEAALIDQVRWTETVGRAALSNKDDNDKQSIIIAASNPHKDGPFMNEMNEEEPNPRKLIVWADARTAVEEGSYPSVEFVKNHEYYKEVSACKRYLLCELEEFSEESMFGEPIIDDTDDIQEYDLFLGVDSAYKGVDKLDAALSGINRRTGMYKVFDILTIEKANWVDGETSRRIIGILKNNINRFEVKNTCIDIGYGVYLVEGLSNENICSTIKGINFGEGTTDFRKDANQYAAIFGANKRAEMHLDLQQLIDGNSIVVTSKVYEKIKEQMRVTKTYIVGDSKKKRIIKKEEIKRLLGNSPDELDSVLLSIHAGILHSLSRPLLLYQQQKGE